jgi:hypothetical protein
MPPTMTMRGLAIAAMGETSCAVGRSRTMHRGDSTCDRRASLAPWCVPRAAALLRPCGSADAGVCVVQMEEARFVKRKVKSGDIHGACRGRRPTSRGSCRRPPHACLACDVGPAPPQAPA